MGIFDSLLGTSTASGTNAAAASNNALINSTLTGTNADLTNSAGNASAALNTGATNASNALTTDYGAGATALTGYGAQAQGQLASGINSAVNTVQGSNGQYAPYVASGTGANNLYSDSLGVNGAAGNAAATSAFQTSPGYQFSVDQATKAAANKAASLGIAGSGSTLDAITSLGSNLANQEYGNWQTNLSGLGAQGLTAANSVSANNQAAGGYQSTGATTGATLAQQTGTNLGTLDAMQGNQQATVQTGLGTGLAGIQTGLGNALTNNAWTGTNAITGNTMKAATADDAATNANNGIFSKLLIGNQTGNSGGLLGTLSSALKL